MDFGTICLRGFGFLCLGQGVPGLGVYASGFRGFRGFGLQVFGLGVARSIICTIWAAG